MDIGEYKVEIFFAVLAVIFTAVCVFFFNYTRLMIKKESALEQQRGKLKKDLEAEFNKKHTHP
jgi:hypothetical protein